jgi:hypothetical protein
MKTAAGPDQIRGVREVLGWLIRRRGSRKFAEPLLAKAGLPAELAEALDDTSWDADLQAETDHALSLTGRDVGTPIIHFQPPHGTAFFGPVISRPPAGEDAVHLWITWSAWRVPRLRRAQAQPARAPPAPQLRRQPWTGRSRRRLASRPQTLPKLTRASKRLTARC